MNQPFDCVECKKRIKRVFDQKNNSIKSKNKILEQEIKLFKAYFESSNSGNIIIDLKKTRILYINSYFSKLFDLDEDNITIDFIKNIFNIKNIDSLKNLFLDKKNNINFEIKHTLDSKEEKWFFVNLTLYNNNLFIQLSDITKQKKEYANFDSLLENTNNFICSIDKNYNLISFNTSFYEYLLNNFNIKVELGMNFEYFINESSYWKDLYIRGLSGEAFIIEKQIKDHFFQVSLTPILIEKDVVGLSIFSKDITKRKNKEMELEELNQKFRNAFDYSPIGIAILDLDGKFLKINNAVSYITGYSEEELLNLTFQDITHPNDLDTDLLYLNEAISDIRNSYNLEKRYIHKNGHIVFVLLSVSVIKDSNNKPLYFLSQIKDITVQKINEEHIRLNQSKLLALIENTNNLIWSIDNNNKIILFNSHFKDFVFKHCNIILYEGLSINECQKDSFFSLFTNLNEDILKGKTISKEIIFANKYYNVSLNPIIDNNLIVGITAFAIDITSKKLMEIDLLESEEKFRGAFDNSPIGMRISDLNGKTIKVNQSFCNIIGYSPEEFETLTHKDISYPEELENESKYIKLLKKDEINKYQIEKRLIHKNGKTIWVSLSVSGIKNSNNNLIYTLAQLEDITEKKEFQLEIISKNLELEKINEELEQFSYLVSHDLQAPLNSIKSYASILDLKGKVDMEDDIDEYVRINIINSCDKMKSFISDLLLYSKAGRKFSLESIDTNIVLDSAINNLKSSIEQINATVEYEYLPDISVNSLKIEQLFQNLIDNALKYRKENIKPIINIKCVSEGDFWKFSIKDNGIGIDLKYQDAIFKTFRRLHSNDKYSGNGIGLSICKKIVEQHGGRIWFDSILGEGTIFYFTIPKYNKLTQASN